MSPARSFSQGDTSSELPRSPHRPTCLAPGPPQKTGQAAVHAQTARRARHHHSARKKEHTGRPQTARVGLWVHTQETSVLKGGKQRNGTTPGVEREAHTRMPTHAHGASKAVTQGRPPADHLPGSERQSPHSLLPF